MSAQDAPPTPAPALTRVSEQSAPISLKDGKQSVTVRVPLALHRGANAYRLYGARPLTLSDHNRRRDLYRDAFIELATRSRLSSGDYPEWQPLLKQLERFRGLLPGAPRAAATGAAAAPDVLQRAADAVGGVFHRAASLPGFENAAAFSRALGIGGVPAASAEPISAALQLRALATDEAAQRLTELGRALNVEAPTTDPALREGYRAARADFDQVRTGVWPAVAASLRQHSGQLTAAAVKDVVLAHLGPWAVFGYAGWQGVENSLNAEYRGQYAVALATVACDLEQAAKSAPLLMPHACYAEFALDYQLTEALKDGQVGGLKPAGGRTAGSWQIELAARCNELRKALEPGAGSTTAASADSR